MKLLHYQAGALVVMVTVFRLGWCAVRRAPKVPAAPGGVVGDMSDGWFTGPVRRLAGRAGGGVVALLAAGKPTVLLGIDLPVWIDGGKAVACCYKHYHESVANGMIALLVLHVGAALWHRYCSPGCGHAAHASRRFDVAFENLASGAPCRTKKAAASAAAFCF